MSLRDRTVPAAEPTASAPSAREAPFAAPRAATSATHPSSAIGAAAPEARAEDAFGIAGSIVDRKYRIDRVVAEGGFGIVYAGEHLALGVKIAFKALRPVLRADSTHGMALLVQFREEARVLSRLRGADVVAVLDSGFSPLGDDPRPVPWMVLEWLEGETLAQYLARRRGHGGHTRDECMRLLLPVLEAVACAHELGVSHRDLKPANIMLVPDRRGVRPKVLDFGLAKWTSDDPAQGVATGATATASPVRAFTTASAAPEQLSGARTGPWTDVYALGLLLTEVLVDRAPVPAGDPSDAHRIAFAAERPTPRQLGVDVGGWDAVLERALAVRPDDRQANARALLQELTSAPDAPRLQRARARYGYRRGALASAALTAMVAAGALGGGSWLGLEAARPAIGPRPLVVVSASASDGAEPKFAAAFAELLTEQLRVGDVMRLPPPDARSAMLEASGLQGASPAMTREILARLAKNVGVEVVVSGALVPITGGLRAEVDIHHAARGELMGHVSIQAPTMDVNALVRDAAVRIRLRLGSPALSVEDEGALRATLPSDAEASLAYVEGLSAMRAYRFRDALTLFERASARAPRFAPLLAARARALLKLGSEARACPLADAAAAVASALPRSDELGTQALAAECRHDWDAAVDAYRTLSRFYPERVDFVTSLSRMLVAAGRGPEATRLLAEASRRPRSDWDRMRIAIATSYASARCSDDASALAAAIEAEQLARAVSARVPLADALFNQASVHERAGQLERAEALVERARDIYQAVHDTGSVVLCDAARAGIARARGNYPAALTIGARVVAAYRAEGDAYRAARETVALAIVHAMAGALGRARALFEEGGQAFIAAHDREGEAYRLLNLAEIDLALGRFDGVDDGLRRARAMHAEIGHGAGVAEADQYRGRVAWLSARLDEAEEAYAIAQRGAAGGDAWLAADIALDRARLALERRSPAEGGRFAAARDLVGRASDARLAALLDVLAARRALALGDATSARESASSALARARGGHAVDALALALAATLEVDPAGPEAHARWAELAALWTRVEAREPRIVAALALSRAASGAQAVTYAARALDDATRSRYVVYLDPAARELARARVAARASRASEHVLPR